jgi:hypothetical protein
VQQFCVDFLVLLVRRGYVAGMSFGVGEGCVEVRVTPKATPRARHWRAIESLMPARRFVVSDRLREQFALDRGIVEFDVQPCQ